VPFANFSGSGLDALVPTPPDKQEHSGNNKSDDDDE